MAIQAQNEELPHARASKGTGGILPKKVQAARQVRPHSCPRDHIFSGDTTVMLGTALVALENLFIYYILA